MADDAGHSDRTRAPRTTEIEIKEIVLDIWIPAN